jgi:hypothetical protein
VLISGIGRLLKKSFPFSLREREFFSSLSGQDGIYPAGFLLKYNYDCNTACLWTISAPGATVGHARVML